jgi:nucleotide-binding universal stress UspA family protein
MFENLLLAIKPGGPYQDLLDLALPVASPDARVHVVSFVRVGKNEDESVRLQAAGDELAAIKAHIESTGRTCSTEHSLIVAAAGLEILSAAETHQSDLIVIALGKRSRMGKALLGSDAQTVLIGAAVPVLSMRRQAGAD